MGAELQEDRFERSMSDDGERRPSEPLWDRSKPRAAGRRRPRLSPTRSEHRLLPECFLKLPNGAGTRSCFNRRRPPTQELLQQFDGRRPLRARAKECARHRHRAFTSAPRAVRYSRPGRGPPPRPGVEASGRRSREYASRCTSGNQSS